ncbi:MULTISPECIES: Arm DNA-binding domain-containing protein [unclassified Bradyrhizobium]|uniref:Arm DNA-binding domain-containing protein n=1 Tax=unclassified Bradyrhizobium TaxID=2631580 RepID=UPI002478A585|nr:MULTISPECIES: Arm DNA-binding domain-containing protein [unclassified Bradyrhizobium]WGS21073.1 Arm DNA-binding domain-containing protein [Bradyrhizobium sp. ISRA463]WGS27990.1 Arm DNA-binding domain-containing protein [Bradyrhizobium sp. ISRA464]
MAGRLKPLDVERETQPGKYPDGDGLYLVVASATSKNWSCRYWKDGKQRWLGLGSLKDVSLKEARLARDAARLRVRGDPPTSTSVFASSRAKRVFEFVRDLSAASASASALSN